MPRLKKVFVEITSRCNLACPFCVPGRRAGDLLSLADCARILPQLKPHTDYLALHVLGEPLLHPEPGPILALCHDLGFRVNLTTNGTLLPERGAMLLASPALRQVNISLHSVVGGGTGHDPWIYLAEVLAFVREAAGAGIHVNLRLWDRPRAVSGTGRWHDAVLTRLEEFFDLPEPLVDTVVAGQGVRLVERVYLSQKELFDWPDLRKEPQSGRGCCPALRDQAAILADGTVVPCCLDAAGAIALGNIFQTSFAAILTGERAQRLRAGFRQRQAVEELCRRCTYKERF